MLLLRDSQEAGRPQACACIESQRRRDIVTGMKLFYTARHSFCQDPPCCPLCTACSGAHRSLPGPRRYPSSTCTSLITWPGLRQQAAPGQLAQLAGRKERKEREQREQREQRKHREQRKEREQRPVLLLRPFAAPLTAAPSQPRPLGCALTRKVADPGFRCKHRKPVALSSNGDRTFHLSSRICARCNLCMSNE
jgi:hypothetical protein